MVALPDMVRHRPSSMEAMLRREATAAAAAATHHKEVTRPREGIIKAPRKDTPAAVTQRNSSNMPAPPPPLPPVRPAV